MKNRIYALLFTMLMVLGSMPLATKNVEALSTSDLQVIFDGFTQIEHNLVATSTLKIINTKIYEWG